MPKANARLGRIGVEGEQKGVDLRIGLDMVGHARNGAVDMVYLVSGDDDLTEAVEETQAQSVQVIVLAVATDGTALAVSVSRCRRGRVGDDAGPTTRRGRHRCPDGTPRARHRCARRRRQPSPSPSIVARRSPPPTALPSLDVSGGLATGSPESIAAEPATGADPRELDAIIGTVATRTFSVWAATATAKHLDDLRRNRPTIPRDLNRALLAGLPGALGTVTLSDDLGIALRARLWDVIEANGYQRRTGRQRKCPIH